MVFKKKGHHVKKIINNEASLNPLVSKRKILKINLSTKDYTEVGDRKVS